MNREIKKARRKDTMIYLASPYSDPDPAVREARFEAVCKKAAELMRGGLNVFSPIAHSHSVAKYGLPCDWDFWEKLDREYLEMSSGLFVLKLDGWKESVGVSAEIAFAESLGLPISYVTPVMYNISVSTEGTR